MEIKYWTEQRRHFVVTKELEIKLPDTEAGLESAML